MCSDPRVTVNNIFCFAPIADEHARILVLGSMPGVESLRQQQYYAHTRNSFWFIMGQLLNFAETLPYDERAANLGSHYVALWDVLNSCIREGSLDSAIDNASVKPNDFKGFFSSHPQIRDVFFNGQKASQIYHKQVLPLVADSFGYIEYHQLPSTSPAMASLGKQQKLLRWSMIVDKLGI